MDQSKDSGSGLSVPGEVYISDDIILSLQWYNPEKDFQDLKEIILNSRKESDLDEFSHEDEIKEKIQHSKIIIGREKKSQNLLGCMFIFRSPLSRSTDPPHCGTFVLVNSRYRGLGLAVKFLTFTAFLCSDMGYTGNYGRVAVTSKNILPSRIVGAKFFGIIPRSVRSQAGQDYIDDLIAAADFNYLPRYEKNMQAWLNKREHSVLQPLTNVEKNWKRFQGRKVLINQDHLIPIRGTYFLQNPDIYQFMQAEEILRSNAVEERCLGIDEFTDEGFMNRRLIVNPREVVIVEQPGGPPVAVAVFGQSGICRMPGAMATIYISVNKSNRGIGLGSALSKYVIDVLSQEEHTGLLVDVFPHSTDVMDKLLKTGFQVVGSLPQAGYVKDKGLLDSILLYADLPLGERNASKL